MVGSEGFLKDSQGALVEGLGGGVAALGAVQPGEVVEAGGDFRMLRAEGLLADRQGTL